MLENQSFGKYLLLIFTSKPFVQQQIIMEDVSDEDIVPLSLMTFKLIPRTGPIKPMRIGTSVSLIAKSRVLTPFFAVSLCSCTDNARTPWTRSTKHLMNQERVSISQAVQHFSRLFRPSLTISILCLLLLMHWTNVLQ